MEVKLTGIDKLTENIDKLMNGINNDLKKIITDGAVDIEREAKIHCPVRRGRLKNNITHKFTNDGNGYVGRVGTDVPYAAWVEFGWKMTPPRQPDDSDHKKGNQETIPFLYPAYNKFKNVIADKIEKVINQRIKQ